MQAPTSRPCAGVKPTCPTLSACALLVLPLICALCLHCSLQPDVYSKYINEGYATYRERTESLPQKIAELHAAGFPQAKPEVKVG